MRSRSYPNCRYGHDHNAFWFLVQCIMGLCSGKQSVLALFGTRDESTISTLIWNFIAKIYYRIPSFYIGYASQDLHKNTTLTMPIFGSTTSRGVNTFAASVREDHRRSFLPRGGLLHVFCNVFCKIHTIAADVLAIRETKLFVQWEHSFHLKAVLPLDERLATAPNPCSDTGPWSSAAMILSYISFMRKTPPTT